MTWGMLTQEQVNQLSKAELNWMWQRQQELLKTTHKGSSAQAAAVAREEVKVKRRWGGDPTPTGENLPKQQPYPEIEQPYPSSSSVPQGQGGGMKEYIKLQKGGRRLVRYGKRGGKYYMKGGQKIYIK